jgi:hypothetical protein
LLFTGKGNDHQQSHTEPKAAQHPGYFNFFTFWTIQLCVYVYSLHFSRTSFRTASCRRIRLLNKSLIVSVVPSFKKWVFKRRRDFYQNTLFTEFLFCLPLWFPFWTIIYHIFLEFLLVDKILIHLLLVCFTFPKILIRRFLGEQSDPIFHVAITQIFLIILHFWTPQT